MEQNNNIGSLPSIIASMEEPNRTKQYPGNLNGTEFVTKYIDTLLEKDIVQKSYSP